MKPTTMIESALRGIPVSSIEPIKQNPSARITSPPTLSSHPTKKPPTLQSRESNIHFMNPTDKSRVNSMWK